jgi:hypothetical protein
LLKLCMFAIMVYDIYFLKNLICKYIKIFFKFFYFST